MKVFVKFKNHRSTSNTKAIYEDEEGNTYAGGLINYSVDETLILEVSDQTINGHHKIIKLIGKMSSKGN